MRSTILALTFALTIVAGSSTLLRSRSLSTESPSSGMPPLQELYKLAGVDKLPVQQIEDLSMETKL
jgi:hypothetical protein